MIHRESICTLHLLPLKGCLFFLHFIFRLFSNLLHLLFPFYLLHCFPLLREVIFNFWHLICFFHHLIYLTLLFFFILLLFFSFIISDLSLFSYDLLLHRSFSYLRVPNQWDIWNHLVLKFQITILLYSYFYSHFDKLLQLPQSSQQKVKDTLIFLSQNQFFCLDLLQFNIGNIWRTPILKSGT